MAKVCKACGLNYHNYADKCFCCGAPLQINKKIRAIKIAVVSTLILAVAIAVAVSLYDYYTSPVSVTDEIMNAYMDGDEAAVMATFPAFLNHAKDLGEYEMKYGFKYWYWGDIVMMQDYLFSYNTDRVVTPSDKQREQLIESISEMIGEHFNPDIIEDVKMVWVDFRGGTMGYWGLNHTRFVMIKYAGEWCWWPFY